MMLILETTCQLGELPCVIWYICGRMQVRAPSDCKCGHANMSDQSHDAQWTVRFVGWADWVDCRCFLFLVFLGVARRFSV